MLTSSLSITDFMIDLESGDDRAIRNCYFCAVLVLAFVSIGEIIARLFSRDVVHVQVIVNIVCEFQLSFTY